MELPDPGRLGGLSEEILGPDSEVVGQGRRQIDPAHVRLDRLVRARPRGRLPGPSPPPCCPGSSPPGPAACVQPQMSGVSDGYAMIERRGAADQVVVQNLEPELVPRQVKIDGGGAPPAVDRVTQEGLV